MIRLEVEPYCQACCSFEADVQAPGKAIYYSGGAEAIFQSDTVVSCQSKDRCANIKRYLEDERRFQKEEQK